MVERTFGYAELLYYVGLAPALIGAAVSASVFSFALTASAPAWEIATSNSCVRALFVVVTPSSLRQRHTAQSLARHQNPTAAAA
jgi:hypothetical protein